MDQHSGSQSDVARRSGPGYELPVGTLVDTYEIHGILGVGGCAAVYLAEDRLTGARVALKVPHWNAAYSPQLIARFAREVTTVKLVSHPGIVVIHAEGQLAEGRPYYVMELLRGMTLDMLVKDRGRLGLAEVMEIVAPLCAALDVVHQAGIVHRDLKASNIFITDDGAQRAVKIFDFGIAKLLRPELSGERFTTAGHPIGTPSCMAPEQILGLTVDHRADIYALGVLLFRMLTGRFPFRGGSVLEIEAGHLETPPPRPSLLAPVERAVDAIVLRCLQKRPWDRYPGVLPLLDDLRNALIGGHAEGSPPSVRPPLPAPECDEPTAQAVGIYVEALVPSGLEQGREDALLDEIRALLDTAERTLLAAGFELPLQTGSALLGVRLLPASPAAERLEWRHATELAAGLRAELTAHPAAGSLLDLLICVHADAAIVKTGPSGPRVAGGPILCLAGWVPSGRRGAKRSETGRPLPGDESGAFIMTSRAARPSWASNL